MSLHLHAVCVEGCPRCEVSRGEAVAETIRRCVAPYAAVLAEQSPATVMLDVGHGYRLVRRGTDA